MARKLCLVGELEYEKKAVFYKFRWVAVVVACIGVDMKL